MEPLLEEPDHSAEKIGPGVCGWLTRYGVDADKRAQSRFEHKISSVLENRYYGTADVWGAVRDLPLEQGIEAPKKMPQFKPIGGHFDQ